MFELYQIATVGNGKLYASPKPDSRQPDHAIDAITTAQIDTLVCLLENKEINALALAPFATQCASHNIETIHLPIPDFGTPELTTLASTVSHLHNRLSDGSNVLIHCRGGIGRTGTVCCALLVAAGKSPYVAIRAVSEKRGCTVPETSAQRELIYRYSEYLHSLACE